MLERLRDKVPVVRAQAARALSRLQDGGETNDFSEDAITSSFLHLLGAEKNKDVRKAILGSLAISDHTIPYVVERTRDASEDVRRVAFLALASKVPVASVSIALRAVAARRGLADRAPTVRAACVDMLHRWLDHFEGDALRLLAALDPESHEDVASAVVEALIQSGRVKPAEVARAGSSSSSTPNPSAPPGGGLRRGVDDPLMTPEAAVYWRVVCERLSAEATDAGSNAAVAVGQRQAVSAAVAGEKTEALEAALPAETTQLLALVATHATAGAVFVARQLLRLTRLVDMTDGATRKMAAALIASQLRSPPTAAADVDADVAGAASSYSLGGDGRWERALVEAARYVHACPAAAAADVLTAADALRNEVDTPEAHAQALFLAGLLLEDLPSSALDAARLEAMMASLVRPGVTHASAGVRREAVKCLGLLGIVAGRRALNSESSGGECVRILRAALAADTAGVRCVAARALGDLALVYGPAALDAHLPHAASVRHVDAASSRDDRDDEHEREGSAAATLERALLRAVADDAHASFERAEVHADDAMDVDTYGEDAGDVDVTGGAALAAAEAEAEGCVGTAAAEALAKVVLRRGPAAFTDGAHVVSVLLGAYFNVDARRRPRLAQCLAVFFPALASAPLADRRRLVAEAALPAMRAAATKKGVARVASYLAHLLAATPQKMSADASDDPSDDPTEGVVGGDALVAALAKEALASSLKPPAGSAANKALVKAYVAALAKLAAAVSLAPSVSPSEAASNPEGAAAATRAMARAAAAAAEAANRVADKVAGGHFAEAARRARVAAGVGDGSERAAALEESVAAMVMEECEALAASGALPLDNGASVSATRARRKTTRAAGRKSGGVDENDEGESGGEEDEEEEDETPRAAAREMPRRASKTAARAKLAEEEEETAPAKTARATRATRAALRENVAR